MADAAAEPSATVGSGTSAPSEKSLANRATANMPSTVLGAARVPDRIILRMNKLLASPGGLSSFLATSNYTLYLLAYLETKSAPLLARIYQLLNRISGRPLIQPAVPVAGAPSHIAALGALFSNTRTTLRLFGLIPMYARMRQLLQGPKPGSDQILYATAVTQCALYMAFQFLENVGLLTDSKALPAAFTARWATKDGKMDKIYLWSYRAWFGGVLCDLVRLAREAQVENSRRAQRAVKGEATVEEDKKTDEIWWSELVSPISWVPVAAQFSKEGGYPWFNLGIMGFCGAMASVGKTAALWHATADV